MKRMVIYAAAVAVTATPLQASPLDVGQSKTGAFVGGRIRLSLGGKAETRPKAELSIAPTRRVVSDHSSQTTIGNGVGLNFSGLRPKLTLAGVPADSLLKPNPAGTARIENKAHLSTAGWTAVGVGVAVVAAVGFALWVDEVKDNSD